MARCPRTVSEGKACILPTLHDGHCTLGPVVEVDYCNWKGLRRIRRIVPTGKMMYESNPPWHPNQQWLMAAIDCEDGKHKFFAMDGFYYFKEQAS